MKKVFLIACSKRKKSQPCIAEEMYSNSHLFNLCLKYARKFSKNEDDIYIISAKYGLLELNTHIQYYDIILNSMKKKERKEWANLVYGQLISKIDIKNYECAVILAGKNYYEELLPLLGMKYEIPCNGLKMGERIHFLKKIL